jgi:general secretion pathway protein D
MRVLWVLCCVALLAACVKTQAVSPRPKAVEEPLKATLPATTDNFVAGAPLREEQGRRSEASGMGGLISAKPREDTALRDLPDRETDVAEPTYSFVFDQAPISTILNEIVSETFGLSFTVPPEDQTRLTVRLENVASVKEALRGLNIALNSLGLNLRQRGDMVELARQGATDQEIGSLAFASTRNSASASTVLFQAQNAPATRLRQLVEPLVPGSTVRLADEDTGIIALQGDQEQIDQALRILRAADVDWLATVGYRIYRPGNVLPSQLTSSLTPLASRSAIEILASDAAGIVTLISRNEDGLGRMLELVRRSDVAPENRINADTLFYETRHIDPERLAGLAGALLGNAPPQEGAGPLGSGDGGFQIAVDPIGGVVVVTGAPSRLRQLQSIFERLDRPVRQVAIEVTVVEVTLRDAFRFGVQWEAVEGLFDFRFLDGTSTQLTSRFPGASLAYSNTDIGAVLNALDSATEIQVVSSPRVLALNNQTASIQVGSEVPIVTQTAVGVTNPDAPIVNSTTYRDTGIILTVTPRIRSGGLVELDLTQEVSDVAESQTDGIDTPTFSQRKLETTLAVPDGSTLAIGGLFSVNQTRNRIDVPGLARIPFAGELFRSRDDAERRTELVVLIRPQIIDANTPSPLVSESLQRALEKLRPAAMVR